MFIPPNAESQLEPKQPLKNPMLQPSGAIPRLKVGEFDQVSIRFRSILRLLEGEPCVVVDGVGVSVSPSEGACDAAEEAGRVRGACAAGVGAPRDAEAHADRGHREAGRRQQERSLGKQQASWD